MVKKDSVLIEYHNGITRVNFMITSTKRYVPVVTLSIKNNIEFLENIKQVFKRTFFWNKYRSDITTQQRNSDLDYMIVPLIGCLFKHSKLVKMILQEMFFKVLHAVSRNQRF